MTATATPTATPTSMLCVLTYDWDADGEVTVNDVLMMIPAWLSLPGSPNWDPRYDVDGDGSISVLDFMLVVDHIGERCDN